MLEIHFGRKKKSLFNRSPLLIFKLLISVPVHSSTFLLFWHEPDLHEETHL